MDYRVTLKQVVKYIPGSVRLYAFLMGLVPPSQEVTRHRLQRGPKTSMEFQQLEREYAQNPLSNDPDTFVIYRIIGNDLVPRHAKGQSRDNLSFILENEPDFPSCEKRFVVNRIFDPAEERAVINLIEAKGFAYLHFPFLMEEYQRMDWDIHSVPIEYAPYTKRFLKLRPMVQDRVMMSIYRHKNNYVMHNNAARNAALKEGKSLAKWVLPWDGNCFITKKAWLEITQAVRARPYIPYFIVPMTRVTDNRILLGPEFTPYPVEEPQVIFRQDITLCFNETFFYGRRPKVELLWRLGVPGPWDEWLFEPWDLPKPLYHRHAGLFSHAGWVARLDSGARHLEGSSDQVKSNRALARNKAILACLDDLDRHLQSAKDLPFPLIMGAPLTHSESEKNTYERLLAALFTAAGQILGQRRTSIQKSTAIGALPKGLYFWRDFFDWPHWFASTYKHYSKTTFGRCVSTWLFGLTGLQYSGPGFQCLFDDITIMALAWHFSGNQRYADHAAQLVRTWFVQPDTAIKPIFTDGLMQKGPRSYSGITGMKNLCFLLDAVSVLQTAGAIPLDEQSGFKIWVRKYIHWLKTSRQGEKERSAKNSRGVYYDLQVASIGAFLGERLLVRDTLRDSRFRILQHFDARGRQPQEMKGSNPWHGCCLNLQGWISLAQLAEACGEDLWYFEGKDGQGIRRGIKWLLAHMGRSWSSARFQSFDLYRFYPIYYACKARYGLSADIRSMRVPSPEEVKPVFSGDSGIRPFWQLQVPSTGRE